MASLSSDLGPEFHRAFHLTFSPPEKRLLMEMDATYTPFSALFLCICVLYGMNKHFSMSMSMSMALDGRERF